VDYGIFVFIGFAVAMLGFTLWTRQRNFGNKNGTPSASDNSSRKVLCSNVICDYCETYTGVKGSCKVCDFKGRKLRI